MSVRYLLVTSAWLAAAWYMNRRMNRRIDSALSVLTEQQDELVRCLKGHDQ